MWELTPVACRAAWCGAPLQVSDGLVAAVDRRRSLMEDLKQPGRRQAAETMAIQVQWHQTCLPILPAPEAAHLLGLQDLKQPGRQQTAWPSRCIAGHDAHQKCPALFMQYTPHRVLCVQLDTKLKS